MKTMKMVIIVSLLIICIYIGIASATPVEEWKKTYGSSRDEIFHSIIQTSDGGYISVGGTSSYGAGNMDIWLVRTDSSGNKKWSKTFGGTYYDEAYSVRQTKDGGYILAGFTQQSGKSDALLIKTDSSGNRKWSKTFGGSKDDGFSSVRQTKDGGYIISGHTKSYGTGDYEPWIVKTDSSGNKQWNKTYGTLYHDSHAYYILQTRDGGYIFVGTTDGYGASASKIDKNGNVEWDSLFYAGEHSTKSANSIVEVSDGYVLAGKSTWYRNVPPFDDHALGWFSKIDNSGNIKWEKEIFEKPIKSLQYTKDGGYIIAGYTYKGSSDTNHNGWIMKTDKNGNEKWNKIFGGAKHDEINSVQQTKDGGYILAGYTKSYGSGNKDGWLIKIVDK